MKSTAGLLLVLQFLLLIGACGDDAGPMDGRPPDGDAPDGGALSSWEPCFDGLRCAVLTVPLDYDDASLGTISLEVVQRSAGGTPAGTIAMLAGGPGNSSMDVVVAQARIYGAALPSWNIVGMDHRGMENSEPRIVCGDDASWDALELLDASPDDATERSELDAAAAAWADACVANTGDALLRRVDSVSAARDLDQLRMALGEERISAFATSYGTILASYYAQLFPDRVGGFVMDSPVLTRVDAREHYRAQSVGYEAALDGFFDWCAATATCAFHTGESADAIAAAFDVVWAEVDATHDLGIRGDNALLSALSSGNREGLANALAALETGSTAELLAFTGTPPTRADGSYTNQIAGWLAVITVDRAWPDAFTRADLEALSVDVAMDAPRLASVLLARRFAAGHLDVRAAHTPPALARTSAPPFLLIAGEEDAAAPSMNAEALRDTFDNGSHLVTVAGPGHGQLGRASACLVPLIVAYVGDPTTAPTTTRCE